MTCTKFLVRFFYLTTETYPTLSGFINLEIETILVHYVAWSFNFFFLERFSRGHGFWYNLNFLHPFVSSFLKSEIFNSLSWRTPFLFNHHRGFAYDWSRNHTYCIARCRDWWLLVREDCTRLRILFVCVCKFWLQFDVWSTFS